MSRLAFCVAVLGLSVTVGPSGIAAQQFPASAVGDSLRWTRVTYVAGRSVYVSAGRDEGIDQGSELDVVKRGVVVATLRVAFVSAHRASGEVVRGDSGGVAVDDSVRYRVRAGVPPAGDSTSRQTVGAPPPSGVTEQRTDADARSGSPTTSPTLRSLGVRGRVGIRYLIMRPTDSGGVGWHQPAADVRVDGQRIAGSPVGLAIDARGRRTYLARGSAAAGRASTRTYVYQMAMSLEPTSGARFAVGRQFSEAFGNVSLYDGVSAQISRRRWGTGLFVGTQPSPATMNYSTAIKELGAYVQAHGTSGVRWTLTGGAVGSYHASDPDREFAFGQLVVNSTRFSLYAVQEVDYNRGWKSDAGEHTVQPTSTYLNVQVRPTDPVTLYAGFDSRRNVRLWRDFVSPETEFDDRFRQGVWGGLSVRAGSHLRVSADVRSSDGGDSLGSRATSAGGTVALERLTRAGIGAHARSTRYTSPWIEGWLHSVTFSTAPRDGRIRLEAEGGIRDEHDRAGVAVTSAADTRAYWLGLGAEAALGRAWYLLITTTRETAGWESNQQVYTSLTYRF